MTKKEFLNQYRNIEIIIGSKLDELAKTRERAEKTTQTLSPDKVKSESSGGLEVSIEKIIGNGDCKRNRIFEYSENKN